MSETVQTDCYLQYVLLIAGEYDAIATNAQALNDLVVSTDVMEKTGNNSHSTITIAISLTFLVVAFTTLGTLLVLSRKVKKQKKDPETSPTQMQPANVETYDMSIDVDSVEQSVYFTKEKRAAQIQANARRSLQGNSQAIAQGSLQDDEQPN